MENHLIESVDRLLNEINLPIIKHSIFYNSPIALRFEISEPWRDVDDFTHFQKSYQKLLTLYKNFNFDILRIDISLDAEESIERKEIYRQLQLNNILLLTKLPFPSECRECHISYDTGREEIPLIQLELYWDLQKIDFIEQKLLMQIILTDFPSQGGGYSEFESSVFFFDSPKNILFHPYDDRGVDIVASNKETLFPLYEKYNSWILDASL